MAAFTLNVEVRGKTGKGDSRRLRAAGKVPGVMYGRAQAPVHLVLESREVERVMVKAHSNTVFELQFAGGKQPNRQVLVRERQLDPISQMYRHIDFQALEADHAIRVDIPIRYNGEPIGKKSGAIFQPQIRKIPVECLPANIPAAIDIDISPLDIGDSVHVSDLPLDAKVKVLLPPTAVLANMTVVKEEIEVKPAAAEGEAAAAPGAEGAAAPAAGAPAAGDAKPAADAKKEGAAKA